MGRLKFLVAVALSVTVIVGSARASAPVVPESYRKRFQELDEKKDHAAAEKLLGEWLARRPDDPAAYVCGANHYFNRSRDVPLVISTEPARGSGLSLTSDSTGKNAGSINPGTPDQALATRAVDLLRQATKRFPDRLDIWFGLAYLQQEGQDWDGELVTLRAAVAQALARPTALVWEEGAPLPAPADSLVPETLHDYAAFHVQKRRGADAEARAIAIATLATRSYPKHPYAFNLLAAIDHAQGDLRGAVDNSEKAHALAPDDMLVLFNLAKNAADLGDVPRARAAWKTVAQSNDARMARAARAELKKLPTKAETKR
jgi:tetratricopeptide (TPR) repeat protein